MKFICLSMGQLIIIKPILNNMQKINLLFLSLAWILKEPFELKKKYMLFNFFFKNTPFPIIRC